MFPVLSCACATLRFSLQVLFLCHVRSDSLYIWKLVMLLKMCLMISCQPCLKVSKYIYIFFISSFCRCLGRTHLRACVCPCRWQYSVCSSSAFVCVSVWDHAAAWEQPEGATAHHFCHRSGGVSVFRWSCVRMGLTCFCPEDGGLLQLFVRQCHRSQCYAGLRSVWWPHLHYTVCNISCRKMSVFLCTWNPQNSKYFWRMMIFLLQISLTFIITRSTTYLPTLVLSLCLCLLCVNRLQWTGWTVLACFHHRLLHEQFPDTSQWFSLWSVWNNSGSPVRNVSPTTTTLIIYWK